VSGDIDILMITYNRPDYTRMALSRLLGTCDESMRVWVWHNGVDEETLAVVRSMVEHPRVHRFHHSPENMKLRGPTNWLFRESAGEYVSKVDDDCLLPDGWAQTLRQAHEDEPRLGVVGCWRFQDEDYRPELARKKIRTLAGGHQVLLNCWVEGSGYLMKRACVEKAGPIRDDESFSSYCIRIAAAGWINGWYHPFIRQEHMDDPRAPHSLLRKDEDLARYLPLSAANTGVKTLAAWEAQLRRSALVVQQASPDPRAHTGWRRSVRSLGMKVRRACGGGRYLG
jgi:glycosyltransferase involved in cell wall biosynthesis